MFAEMNATTVIPTDLVTPLGAYLRLRPEDGASFLLESVEHGRLGRHSFVGYGTRIVAFEEAEASEAEGSEDPGAEETPADPGREAEESAVDGEAVSPSEEESQSDSSTTSEGDASPETSEDAGDEAPAEDADASDDPETSKQEEDDE